MEEKQSLMTDEKFKELKKNIEQCLVDLAKLQATYRQQTGREYRPSFVVGEAIDNWGLSDREKGIAAREKGDIGI